MIRIGSVLKSKQFLFMLMLLATAIAYGQPQVTASLDASQVLVQESFTWTLEVEGSDVMPSVRLGDIDKIALLSGPMQSSNYSIVNGKTSSKKSISYTFIAMEAGQVLFPAVDVVLGSKKYKTKPLKLEIVAARGSGGKSVSASQSVYLRAIPSKYSVYVGEPLTVRYKLFTKVGVYNYQVEKLPDAVGFWAEEIPQSAQPRLVSEVVDGVRYNTAVLKTVLYYPTKSGELIIDPLKTELEIEVKSNQRSNRRFNDPFFNDPFFSGNRKATKDFLSNPIKITVKSLPEPRPRNFSGAVGNFQIRAGLDTNAVFANDAVGLSVSLTGSGNFKSLQLPEPKLPEGIDIFKPERTEAISIKGMKHSGSKKSTYLLVPRIAGELLIEPIKFTYFDLSKGKYVTRSSGDIKLSVYDVEGSQPVVTSGYSREEVELMQQDIRYIKSSDSNFTRAEASSMGGMFWALHILGLLILGGTFAYEYQSSRLEGNVDLRRRTNAIKEARKQIRKAEKLSEDSEELRALLHQCITGIIGARLNVSENTLDTSEFSELLTKHDVPQDVIDENTAFLENLAMDRFAPGAVKRSAPEWISATQDLFQKLRRVL
ncbi:MAG: protein BatD [Candidatus Marinimicrobia bacterium]|nr:protein BatD [Candidatus Neomarinimicrobiota bacterium]